MNETKRTLRERKFIESYIDNNGNATKAYLTINSKVNKNTAGVLGNRMLRKVKININFILNQVGLNDVYLSGKLKEGLESENLSIRVRYLDMALKLKNKYPAEKEKETHKVIILGAKNKLIAKINKITERNKDQESS